MAGFRATPDRRIIVLCGNVLGGKGFFYGYKVHAGNDAYYGLPLYAAVAPANAIEGPRLRSDLDAMLKLHPDLKPRYLLVDKGYHALYNFRHAVEKGITPIIDIPRPPRDKATKQRLYDGIYTADGRPTCVGQQPMDYLGTDTDGAHWFRCPSGGCQLKNKLDWSRYCNHTHWENPTGKLMRTMGIIPRFSSAWKELYQKRNSIERYFSSAKQSRLLNRHQCLGQAKVELHVNMATLAYALTALALEVTLFLLEERRNICACQQNNYQGKSSMQDTQLSQISNFIWGVADDFLRDLYVTGKYRDVILPITVLSRLDAVLEPTMMNLYPPPLCGNAMKHVHVHQVCGSVK